MKGTYWCNLVLACLAVLSVPTGAAHSLRRAKQAPDLADPEIAEAEALASQAEAEAEGDVEPAVANVPAVAAKPAIPTPVRSPAPVAIIVPPAAAKPVAIRAPPAGDVHHALLPKIVAAIPASQNKRKPYAAKHAGKVKHWGAAAHAAVHDALKPALKPAHVSTHPASPVHDSHSTVRAAVRAAVKEVLPKKPSKRSRKAMRRLPEDVTRRVGEIAYNSAPGGTPPRPSSKGAAPPGITEVGDKDDFDDTQDFRVEPGLAYGHGEKHTTVADQKALDEARRLEEEERERQAAALKEQRKMEQDEPSKGAKQRRMLHEVEELEKDIAEETKSESLAYMLGGVKMDLYQLHEKMDMLQKDVGNGVPLEPAGIDEALVYPLSACMKCIFLLSAQYFILYTAVAICKVFVDIFDLGEDTVALRSLRVGCDTVFYAPMLCVLFLGAHLRALQITLGKGGPQDWAETAMQVCAWSCLVQTCMVLAIPFFTGKRVLEADRRMQESSGFAGFLTVIRYVALAGMYAGLVAVCIAVTLMDARSLGTKPIDIWDDPRTAKTEYAPQVSVAMICTIALTLFFFVIHFIYAALWSCKELVRSSPGTSDARAVVASLADCLHACTSAVNLAPMLCILFIAARMRALQMDPKWGRPQPWAENCFYACVGGVMAQVFMIVMTRIAASKTMAPRVQDGSTPFQKVVLFCSYLATAVTYTGCVAVMVSVFTITAKAGAKTPPVSPAMVCVMFLVVLYLGVYLAVFVSQVAHLSSLDEAAAQDGNRSLSTPRLVRLQVTLKMSENTVKFGPMLAVLFVAARMRALQLSNQKGSPQCWAQDAMYMASGAVLLQLVMVLATGALSPAADVDDAGSLITKRIEFLPGRIFLEVMKAATFVMLFGGVFTVVASMLMIRPGTAVCKA